MTEIETKIGLIGWENQNDRFPVVCLDKKMRTALGLEDIDSVGIFLKVTLGERSAIARAGKQFKAMVGSNTITINEKLASELDGANNDIVKVSTISEEESVTFEREFQRQSFEGFLRLIGANIQERARNNNVPRDHNNEPME